MGGHAFEGPDEVALRIDAELPRGLDQRQPDAQQLRALLAAGVQRVVAQHGHLPQTALGEVVVERHVGVVQEAHQRVPVVEAVLHRLPDGVGRQQVVDVRVEPRADGDRDGPGVLLPVGEQGGADQAAGLGLALDPVEVADEGERAAREQRGLVLVVAEGAQVVRVEARLAAGAVGEEVVKDVGGVGDQRAGPEAALLGDLVDDGEELGDVRAALVGCPLTRVTQPPGCRNRRWGSATRLPSDARTAPSLLLWPSPALRGRRSAPVRCVRGSLGGR